MRNVKLLAIALLSTAAIASPVQSAERVVIPLTPYLGLPSIELSVNGRRGRFLLDSAGGLTTISPEFAESISCTPWGRITGHRMRGDRVDLARCEDVQFQATGASFSVATAGVWDFKQILPPGAPPLQGAIALDALHGQAVTIDLASRQLVIESEDSLASRISGAQEVPTRFMRDAQGLALTPLVGIDTGKGRVWLELDCGSDAPLMLDRHTIAAISPTPGPLATISIAPGLKIEAKPVVGDFILDGNIGAPVIKQWTVTLDLKHERLWIAQRPAAK